MKKIDKHDHQILALWAANCAAHVLLFFEKEHPEDERPRKAIEAVRLWVRGVVKMSEARKLALAAHAAARDAKGVVAPAAARAAGHAAATAHVPAHAKYAASYAVKASIDHSREREWQLQNLPPHLTSMIQ